jgi:hypothetical protein
MPASLVAGRDAATALSAGIRHLSTECRMLRADLRPLGALRKKMFSQVSRTGGMGVKSAPSLARQSHFSQLRSRILPRVRRVVKSRASMASVSSTSWQVMDGTAIFAMHHSALLRLRSGGTTTVLRASFTVVLLNLCQGLTSKLRPPTSDFVTMRRKRNTLDMAMLAVVASCSE